MQYPMDTTFAHTGKMHTTKHLVSLQALRHDIPLSLGSPWCATRDLHMRDGATGSNLKPSAASSECRGGRWAQGNPYGNPFPRARLWTPKDLSGLSGERRPLGWDTQASDKARSAAHDQKVSAKELYEKLARGLHPGTSVAASVGSSTVALPVAGKVITSCYERLSARYIHW